jgi:hypothetical protein
MTGFSPRNERAEIGQAIPALVPTTTMLPSGSLVTARVIETASGRYSVSDDGAAQDDLMAAGHPRLSSGDRRKGSEIAASFGLRFVGDGFHAESVDTDQLPAAVVYVAEATRRWVSEIIEVAGQRRDAGIVADVEERVRRALPNVGLTRERELVGASSKRHRFDLVAELGRDRLAIFEIVSPHPNALSAVHLKLFDIMTSHPEWPREVVTNRIDAWPSADMVLLSGVASHVRDLASDWSDLGRLAGASVQ